MLRKNILANFGGQLWNGVLQLAVVPFYLAYLNVEAYGLIGFFVSLQAVVGVLDFGLATTTNREMASRSSRPGLHGEMRHLLRSMELIYLALALVVALVFFVFSTGIAWHWVVLKKLTPATVRLAVILFGVTLGLRWPVALYVGTLRGLEKQVLLNGATALISTFKNVGAVLVILWIEPSITAFLLWQLTVTAGEVVVMNRLAWHCLPPVQGLRPAFSARLFRGFWKFSASVGLISLFATVLKQMDKIMISKILSLEELGYFNTATVANTGIFLFCIPIFQAVFPRFSALYSAGEERKLAAIFHDASRLVAIAVAPLAVIMSLFADPVLQIWTRSGLVAEKAAPALSILALSTLLNSMMQVPYALQLAANLTYIPLWLNIIGVFIMVPLIWTLVGSWGIVGGATAWLIFNGLYFAVVPVFTHRHVLRGEHRRWLVGDVLPPVATALAVFGALRLVFHPERLSRGLFIPALAAAVAVYIVIVLRIYPDIRGRLAEWRTFLAKDQKSREGDKP